jgi:hypothetical protein
MENIAPTNTPKKRLPLGQKLGLSSTPLSQIGTPRSSSNDATDAVKVFVRIRPYIEPEDEDNGFGDGGRESVDYVHIHSHGNQISLSKKKFAFDNVYDASSSQENIFSDVGKPVADAALQGYNGTVFAYGQTGSGKTHTMMGAPEDPGLIPRVIQYMFQELKRKYSDADGISFKISVSYLEIYNERVVDLLDVEAGTKDLRENTRKKQVYVEGLVEKEVSCPKEAAEWMAVGNNNRKVGSTKMNSQSSRSHAVFTLNVSIASMQSGVRVTNCSKVNLVDLAGSERQGKTKATGERLKEGANINKSLSALGNVIKSLVSAKKWHVAYRNSKLTFLLRDSLGGNSQTSILAAVSPEISNAAETLSTLEFVQRAKKIKNKVMKNEDTAGTNESLRHQVRLLQIKLDAATKMNEEAMAKTQENRDEEVLALQTKLEDATERAVAAERQLETVTLHHAMNKRRDSSLRDSVGGFSPIMPPLKERSSEEELSCNEIKIDFGNERRTTLQLMEDSVRLSTGDVDKINWRQSIESLNIQARESVDGVEAPLLTLQIQTLRQEVESLNVELECAKKQITDLRNVHEEACEQNAILLRSKMELQTHVGDLEFQFRIHERAKLKRKILPVDPVYVPEYAKTEMGLLREENRNLLGELMAARHRALSFKVFKDLEALNIKNHLRKISTSMQKFTENATIENAKKRKAAKCLKDYDESIGNEFGNWTMLSGGAAAKGKRQNVYFVPSTFAFDGSVVGDDLDDISKKVKKISAYNVLEHLKQGSGAVDWDKFISAEGKSVRDSKSRLRNEILERWLVEHRLQTFSKAISKWVKKKKQAGDVSDVLLMSESDLKTVGISKDEKALGRFNAAKELFEATLPKDEAKRHEKDPGDVTGADRVLEQEIKLTPIQALKKKYGKRNTAKKAANAGNIEDLLVLIETSELHEGLYWCALEGHLDMATTIYNKLKFKSSTFDIDLRNDDGDTAFHMACRNGHAECAAFLKECGSNINTTDNDSSRPIMDAAYNNNVEVVEYLIGQGAVLKEVDKDGMSALDYAYKKKNKQCIRLIDEAIGEPEAPKTGGRQRRRRLGSRKRITYLEVADDDEGDVCQKEDPEDDDFDPTVDEDIASDSDEDDLFLS